MRKALIVDFWNTTPHLETSFEIAKNLLDEGCMVIYVFMGYDVQYSEGLVKRTRVERLLDRAPEVRAAKLIKHKNFIFFSRYRLPKCNTLKLNENFVDIKQLKREKFEGFSIGIHVTSSLVSKLGDANPPLDSYKILLKQMLQSWVSVYEATKKLIDQYAVEEVYIFNGRFLNYGAVESAARCKNLKIYFHERGSDIGRYFLKNYKPHNFNEVQKDILKNWENELNTPLKVSLAESYFHSLSVHDNAAWESAAIKQKIGFSPFINPDKFNIVYYASSDDEFVAVDEYYEKFEWEDQLAALTRLIEESMKYEDVELHIRLHPYLINKSLGEISRWHELGHKYKNINLISERSEYDSYQILKQSDLVVSAGSTVGIEAVFWGKPSILIAPSLYDKLGACYIARDGASLSELIKNRKNLVVESQKSLPYGYFMARFGEKFTHYKAQNHFSGQFMGNNLQNAGSLLSLWRGLNNIFRIVKIEK